MQEFDANPQGWTIEKLSDAIISRVHNRSFVNDSQAPAHFQALNLLNVTHERKNGGTRGSIEIRSNRAPRNIQEFIKIVRLYQQRIEYLKSFDKPIAYNPLPLYATWEEENLNFKKYLEEAKLDPIDYRELIPLEDPLETEGYFTDAQFPPPEAAAADIKPEENRPSTTAAPAAGRALTRRESQSTALTQSLETEAQKAVAQIQASGQISLELTDSILSKTNELLNQPSGQYKEILKPLLPEFFKVQHNYYVQTNVRSSPFHNIYALQSEAKNRAYLTMKVIWFTAEPDKRFKIFANLLGQMVQSSSVPFTYDHYAIKFLRSIYSTLTPEEKIAISKGPVRVLSNNLLNAYNLPSYDDQRRIQYGSLEAIEFLDFRAAVQLVQEGFSRLAIEWDQISKFNQGLPDPGRRRIYTMRTLDQWISMAESIHMPRYLIGESLKSVLNSFFADKIIRVSRAVPGQYDANFSMKRVIDRYASSEFIQGLNPAGQEFLHNYVVGREFDPPETDVDDGEIGALGLRQGLLFDVDLLKKSVLLKKPAQDYEKFLYSVLRRLPQEIIADLKPDLIPFLEPLPAAIDQVMALDSRISNSDGLAALRIRWKLTHEAEKGEFLKALMTTLLPRIYPSSASRHINPNFYGIQFLAEIYATLPASLQESVAPKYRLELTDYLYQISGFTESPKLTLETLARLCNQDQLVTAMKELSQKYKNRPVYYSNDRGRYLTLLIEYSKALGLTKEEIRYVVTPLVKQMADQFYNGGREHDTLETLGPVVNTYFSDERLAHWPELLRFLKHPDTYERYTRILQHARRCGIDVGRVRF